MLKRILSGLLALGLLAGLVGAAPAVACNDCPGPVPVPDPVPVPCGPTMVRISTDIFVGDECGCGPECYDLTVRFLEEFAPAAVEMDLVHLEWCGLDAPVPAVGANGIVTVESVVVADGVATVTFRLDANPDAFDGGFFGREARGLEVTLNGRTNATMIVLWDLVVGTPPSIDWGWLWGGDIKLKIKASAKASSKVYAKGGSLKASAKASAKVSVKASSKLGGWKYSAKASAKASSKVYAKNGSLKTSAKASAKASVKVKGTLPGPIPPVWALAVAGAHAGPGPAFHGALAQAWAGALANRFPLGFGGRGWFLSGPVGPGALAIAGNGAFGGAGAVAVAGVWFPAVVTDATFVVIDVVQGDCPCDCDCDCDQGC